MRPAVKEKILIAEDNPNNMRLLEMILKAKGYPLLMATDGEKALEVAAREKPALIIMDIQLPKMSGLEVTARIRQIPALEHISIIAVTANAMKGDEEKATRAGCDVYLPKPIDTRQLPVVVAEMLLKRKPDNRPP